MIRTPFKMKGSPMERNFGIGSPLQKDKDSLAMREKIKEVKAQNLKETNRLLASQGKKPVEEIKEPSDKASPVRAGIFEGGFGGPNIAGGLKAHWDDTMGAYFKGRKARKEAAAESYK